MKGLKGYESVKRWLNGVFADGIRSEATESLYIHFLGRFCEYAKKDPDQLIEERRQHLRSQDEFVRRQHEELLTKWRNYLETEEKIARSSVGTAHNVVKSFYKYNYVELEAKSPKTWPATKRKVPTPEELAKMVDITPNIRDKTVIVCLAQSGISLGDFLGITYEMVKPELEKEITPLHLDMRRSKVMKDYDTFLGEDSLQYLKQYLEKVELKPSSEIFQVTDRSIEYLVKRVSLKAGLKPHVTPHKLRSFFNTYLALSFHGFQSQHIPIVDYWMGHVLPYGGAYLVPPVEEQRQIYRAHENAISISEKKRESFQIYQAYRSLVEKHGEEEALKILGGITKRDSDERPIL